LREKKKKRGEKRKRMSEETLYPSLLIHFTSTGEGEKTEKRKKKEFRASIGRTYLNHPERKERASKRKKKKKRVFGSFSRATRRGKKNRKRKKKEERPE